VIAGTRRTPRAAAVALALQAVLATSVARADRLDDQVQAVIGAPGDPVSVGVWFGPPGEPLYQLAADHAMPAASVVKTAVLIELFAAHAGHLDEPLGSAADAIVADDNHPAMAPFAAAQRAEIRSGLTGATVRTVGAIVMGSRKASNAIRWSWSRPGSTCAAVASRPWSTSSARRSPASPPARATPPTAASTS
jgi:hypothetical protein